MNNKIYLAVDDISPEFANSMLQGFTVTIEEEAYFFKCKHLADRMRSAVVLKRQAHEEATEFWKKILPMWAYERRECFGTAAYGWILDLGYENAKLKYDAWVEKNRRKDMTQEEIEAALGYKINIVSKKEGSENG